MAATTTTHIKDNGINPVLSEAMAFLMIIETDQTKNAWVMVSVAESAMKQASGMTALIECWGCTGVDGFNDKRFHRYSECPNKHHEKVRAQAMIRIKELSKRYEENRGKSSNKRRYKNNAMLTRTDAVEQWDTLGFVSQQAAENICAMMLRTTKPATRRKLSEQATVLQAQPISRQDKLKNLYTDEDVDEQALLLMFIPILNTEVKLGKPLPLGMQQELPHINFQIGNRDGHPMVRIKGVVNSYAGVSIGELNYHKAMVEYYPELVAIFKPVSHYTDRNILIGGANENGEQMAVTHLISYKTPYTARGQPVRITLGLLKDAAATVLFSVGFLSTLKAAWSFDP
eukprot:CAMPEP_0178919748 /NCGR_PEP_ID=MMETSP0786-20121207/14615_1 /TAXON_ID=186022 /ORGANISM="Thalassionema frauenfeldii, Strain CCMP 1798" /LENGTH=342 /DNA_ID=CAMNT_0020593725 /DNA_START=2387 /DNA_END=3412 /DNA_ORIENTATION=-